MREGGDSVNTYRRSVDGVRCRMTVSRVRLVEAGDSGLVSWAHRAGRQTPQLVTADASGGGCVM